MKLIYILVLMTVAHLSHADALADGGKIYSIANTSSNTDKFSIWVTGGTGECVGPGQQIVFQRLTTVDPIYERAYATALMAYATQDDVTVDDYGVAGTCGSARYIKVSR